MLPPREFALLGVKASIAPQSENWPSPDFSKTSILGDKPHVDAGELHWSTLHDAVSEARDHVLKALGAMAAINDDKSLSDVGKAEKKQEIATKAIASFEAAKSLAKARAAVAAQVKRWDEKLGLAPKPPEGISAAMVQAEVRAHLSKMKPAERMAFIERNAAEVGPAVLTAPSFLSGLTPAELGIVKQCVAARTNPEIAAAKQATTKALSETEAGWRAAIRQISDRGGLGKVPHDGAPKM